MPGSTGPNKPLHPITQTNVKPHSDARDSRPPDTGRDDVLEILIRIEQEVKASRDDMASARNEMHLRDKLYLNAFAHLESRVDTVEKLATKYATKEEVKALKVAVNTALTSTHSIKQEVKEVAEDAHEALRQTSNHDWKVESDNAAIKAHMKHVEEGVWKMALEIKKDPTVIIPAVLALSGLGVLFALGKISWQEVLGAIVLLNLSSLFGKKHKKPEEKESDK